MSCQQNSSVEPTFPPTKAYYSFRVFKLTDPNQPRNEVGFDTLTYRAEDGTIRILTNRTIYFTNEYDTTIYANVPTDRVLEGYLSSSKAKNVIIEVGLIDKTGAKRTQDYQSTGAMNQSQAVPVRLRVRKEVPLGEISTAN
ncbi:hypothetical protein F5984_25515 [Rudanella paleaurantiibacter]|uniref:Uncharacterized protein n=2 Tax=Rudanella paleaurantiibacter TaxID=2614655 RepID=A0A7J5TSE3_9BACT|nr:hypothetical protein F5984_25515 [Rudanella paleaurantiibacter]